MNYLFYYFQSSRTNTIYYIIRYYNKEDAFRTFNVELIIW